MLDHLWHYAHTLDGVRGTAWTGYQCVTEYLDHYAPGRSRQDEQDARALRVLTTDGPDRLKRAAWDRLIPA